MNVKEIFAVRLRQLRRKKKLSQGQLSDLVGASRGSISYYENAERVADIEVLSNTANYFNVTADYLIGHTDNLKYSHTNLADAGLSDGAIDVIKDCPHKDIVNYFIEHPAFRKIIEFLSLYDPEKGDDKNGLSIDEYASATFYYWERDYIFLKSNGLFKAILDDIFDQIKKQHKELSKVKGK